MSVEVEEFLDKATKWQPQMRALREILLSLGLDESLKWRQPCYSDNGKNIAIIGAFKAYCELAFFKGALLPDPEKILTTHGENSQSAKGITFTTLQELEVLKPTIITYIQEAIEIERQGKKVEFKKVTEYPIPAELTQIFEEIPEFKTAFEALTPGRQRGYLLFFGSPKQSATRTARIEKMMQQIFEGKGVDDCTCGLTQKPPRCDGSHKTLNP